MPYLSYGVNNIFLTSVIQARKKNQQGAVSILVKMAGRFDKVAATFALKNPGLHNEVTNLRPMNNNHRSRASMPSRFGARRLDRTTRRCFCKS